MPVTLDHATLETERLGLHTVGQLLSHLKRDNRLVVNLLIDGQEPDYDDFAALRQSSLAAHTLFVETAEPREIATEALAEVESQMEEADRLTGEAVALLQKNQPAGAMQKLSGCFTTWQHAQDSVDKTAQLLRIDLDQLMAEGQSLSSLMSEFSDQLRSIKDALESRDYVALGDVLTYETPETTKKWRGAMGVIRASIA
jgi:hypothetical protein